VNRHKKFTNTIYYFLLLGGEIMNCPNCGAETNESVCPVCGAAVGTSGGFKLAGNDQPQQPEGVTYDAQPQQGMGMDPQYGGPQYQGDPMQNGYAGNAYGTDYQQPTKKKKSGVGAVIGIIIALAVIAAAVIFLFSGSIGGAKKSKKLVDDFMTGIEEADTAKIVSLVDKECVADNDVATLSSSFELLTSMGVEYSIDYKITSTEKANRATIKNMCEGLYGDTSVASKVRCAYICDVDYTMTINYLGETETEDDKMSLICYKKGGKWYIGGTVENE
jgi:hypothetical protein